MARKPVDFIARALAALLVLASSACGGGGDPAADGGGGGDSDPDLVATWTGYEVGDTVTVWTFDFDGAALGAATGGTEVYSGTYTVDTSKDPSYLTVVITDSSITQYIGETTNGIYEISGDQLTFAANEPGDSRRPSSFTPGNGARVFELTRQ